jgi:hypothetical protein
VTSERIVVIGLGYVACRSLSQKPIASDVNVFAHDRRRDEELPARAQAVQKR